MSKRKINDDQPNIDDNQVLPHIKPYRERIGDYAVTCKCGSFAATAHPTTEIGYSSMECFVFSCQNHGYKNIDIGHGVYPVRQNSSKLI